jgi:hypothetical protein
VAFVRETRVRRSAHASTNAKGGKSATYAQMKARLTSISKDALQRCSPYDGARMILSDVSRKTHRERYVIL